ncbi:MAG: GAF domain-containing protein [Cryomorphaceae bacterium]|nr:GAF domain-containing protein [Cryomorphaceae bacterium]
MEISNAVESKLNQVVQNLSSNYPGFDWVGFYLMNPKDKTLHLGPFVGEATDHKVIPFGKGICGQVAISGKTFHAENVHEEDNYIACSLQTKSELVIPVYDSSGKLVAQLDIDSHQTGVFTPNIIEECEKICKELQLIF